MLVPRTKDRPIDMWKGKKIKVKLRLKIINLHGLFYPKEVITCLVMHKVLTIYS